MRTLFALGLAVGALAMLPNGAIQAQTLAKAPVYIGLNLEFGHKTSTSDDAILLGTQIAVDEINRAGGVLGGRPLAIIEKDDRSVPARGVANIQELAANPDLVAVYCGKFSPVALEALKLIHEIGLPLLDPWAAADGIIDNGFSPNYAFRLSMRDTWAMNLMLRSARKAGHRRVALLLPNTAWGRSNQVAAENFLRSNRDLQLAATRWYNWGDASLAEPYDQILASGAQVVILVANEKEGSLLVREMARRAAAQRLPVLSHWGVSGGDFVELAGPSLQQVDFSVVQTFSFIGAKRREARALADEAVRRLKLTSADQIPSPVGVAHAYDLTHILARALERAGSTDRAAIRSELERVENYAGAIKHYARPFTPQRHEALSESDLFIARFRADGSIHPTTDRRSMSVAAKQ